MTLTGVEDDDKSARCVKDFGRNRAVRENKTRTHYISSSPGELTSCGAHLTLCEPVVVIDVQPEGRHILGRRGGGLRVCHASVVAVVMLRL